MTCARALDSAILYNINHSLLFSSHFQTRVLELNTLTDACPDCAIPECGKPPSLPTTPPYHHHFHIPVTLTSTRPEAVPMLLVASQMYVPLMSYVTGPLKRRVLFRISTFLGSDPFNLSVKRDRGVRHKATQNIDPLLHDPTQAG